jgi:hypothetical protein
MAKICKGKGCGVVWIAASETCPVCKSKDYEEKELIVRRFKI